MRNRPRFKSESPRYGIRWKQNQGFPDPRGILQDYRAIQDNAEMDVVDVTGLRRYFDFRRNGFVQIFGNLVVFDDDWCEEVAVNEDEQFPKNKRMDE